MRCAVFRDGNLEQVLDHADSDAIIVAMARVIERGLRCQK